MGQFSRAGAGSILASTEAWRWRRNLALARNVPGFREALAKLALDRHGRIDAIFNNAGVMPTANLSEIHRDEWNRVRFRFTDEEIIVAMVDNSAVRSVVAMLPLTLEFRDYAGIEKVSDPPRKLDTSDVPGGYDPSVGDLTLYAPWGNLAFFYRDHGSAGEHRLRRRVPG